MEAGSAAKLLMKLEHIAFNVADPVAMAAWYGDHCGLRVVRHLPEPFQTHFLADENASIIEIYCNPPEEVPEYWAMHPLLFHLALESKDAVADSKRLSCVGATIVDEVRLPDSSHLIMMRDPWGLSLQICQRPIALL